MKLLFSRMALLFHQEEPCGSGAGESPHLSNQKCVHYCSSEALCWEAVSSRPMSSWLALRQSIPRFSATTSASRGSGSCPCSGVSVDSHGSEKCFKKERSKDSSAYTHRLHGPSHPTHPDILGTEVHVAAGFKGSLLRCTGRTGSL